MDGGNAIYCSDTRCFADEVRAFIVYKISLTKWHVKVFQDDLKISNIICWDSAIFLFLSQQPKNPVRMESRFVQTAATKASLFGCSRHHTCRFALATIMDSWRRQNNCVIAFCGDRTFVSRALVVIILRPSIIRSSDRPTAFHSLSPVLGLNLSLRPPSICACVCVCVAVCLFASFITVLPHLRLCEIPSWTRQVVISSCCHADKTRQTEKVAINDA